ncbi:MAG: FAD-dependent oxidoreductase [Thermodesulfobacteriota bacterium]|nr:FAD-dependent oxidoreductase [Thermodesulfobacteriota bacterium]
MKHLEELFKPIYIRSARIKNRIAMTCVVTNYSTVEGIVTEREVKFFEERAKGGAGLLIANCNCDPESKRTTHTMAIYDDSEISGLKRLTDSVHAHGATIALQINHEAGRSALRVADARQVQRASYFGRSWIHELSLNDIERVKENLVRASVIAKKAGFDILQLQCAHGTLMEQMLLSLTNKRTDSYGGDLEGRVRFVSEVVRGVKEENGEDFPVICRIGAGDHLMEEMKAVCGALEMSGVDGFDVSVLVSRKMVAVPPPVFSQGCFLAFAEAIKKTAGVPVITVGRIIDPVFANDIIKMGKADIVGMTRSLLADPELPDKATTGRLDDIKKCVGCLSCFDRLSGGLDIACTVNPAMGKEQEYPIGPGKRRKRVLVVGGGPGGMEAARVAALRGHSVTLYDRNGELGGQLILASLPPYKRQFSGIIKDLAGEIKRLGVTINLRKEVTAEMLLNERCPDVAIIATGSIPIIPQLPGIKNNNVVIAQDVIAGTTKPGDKVAVIGGGLIGCETADFLAAGGYNVTIIEMLEKIGGDIGGIIGMFLKLRLNRYGVNILIRTRLLEVRDKGVIVDKDGEKQFLEVDTVVLAVGSKPENELVKKLESKVPELYAVGDCVRPQRLLGAIHEGSEIALSI